jgi:hypothetical protein
MLHQHHTRKVVIHPARIQHSNQHLSHSRRMVCSINLRHLHRVLQHQLQVTRRQVMHLRHMVVDTVFRMVEVAVVDRVANH